MICINRTTGQKSSTWSSKTNPFWCICKYWCITTNRCCIVWTSCSICNRCIISTFIRKWTISDCSRNCCCRTYCRNCYWFRKKNVWIENVLSAIIFRQKYTYLRLWNLIPCYLEKNTKTKKIWIIFKWFIRTFIS